MGFDLGVGRLLCWEETIDKTAHRQRWAGLTVRKQCLLYRKSEEQRWKGKEWNGKQAVEELWSAGLETGSLVMGVTIDDGTTAPDALGEGVITQIVRWLDAEAFIYFVWFATFLREAELPACKDSGFKRGIHFQISNSSQSSSMAKTALQVSDSYFSIWVDKWGNGWRLVSVGVLRIDVSNRSQTKLNIFTSPVFDNVFGSEFRPCKSPGQSNWISRKPTDGTSSLQDILGAVALRSKMMFRIKALAASNAPQSLRLSPS